MEHKAGKLYGILYKRSVHYVIGRDIENALEDFVRSRVLEEMRSEREIAGLIKKIELISPTAYVIDRRELKK